PTLAERGVDDVLAWFTRFVQKALGEIHQVRSQLSPEAEQEIRSIPLDKWGDNIRGVYGVAESVATERKLPTPPPQTYVISGDTVRNALAGWRFTTNTRQLAQSNNAWVGLNLTQAEGAVFQKYLTKWDDPGFREQVLSFHRKAWDDSEGERIKKKK